MPVTRFAGRGMRFLLLLTLLFGAAPVSAGISIIYPQEHQVFQRDGSNVGTIAVYVSGLTPGNSIRATLTLGNVRYGSLQSGTQPNNVLVTGVPAGGWFQLQVEELNPAGNRVGTPDFRNIAVGEVFIAAGQSNSFQFSQASIPPDTVTGVAAAGANFPFFGSRGSATEYLLPTWHLGIDDAAQAGASPWLYFAKELAARLNVPVGIISVGCGTTTGMWLNNTPPNFVSWADPSYCGQFSAASLYFGLLHAAQSLSGGFRAVLWHQGESDAISQMTQAETYNNMRKLIIDLNRDLGFTAAGITVPWFVAKAAYYPISRALLPTEGDVTDGTSDCTLTGLPYPKAPAVMAVRAAQQQLVDTGFARSGPDTDALIGAAYRFPAPAGGCSHFTNSALQVHGHLWYRAVAAANLIADLAAPAPTAGTAMVYRLSKKSDPADIQYSTTAISGYDLAVEAFRVYNVKPADGLTLYRCTITVTLPLRPVHFVSNDAGCEGQTLNGTLGYVSAYPKIGTPPSFARTRPPVFSTSPRRHSTRHCTTGLR